ncbi:hypothetical protein PR202_ga21588 [Eleusine coracana subsp. coracana]|uniref:PAS domain-containing protein n=1 Tax=Eleusine coracana subsp. coracana TaxID=191504 RepID=A0AAV5D1T2_ELECO|nr:hypothetical protein PR202_ga21588 [Eleusine coracana subsp. coracana]
MDVEELARKLRELEESQAELKREVSKLTSAGGALCQQLASSFPRSALPPPRSSRRRQRVGLSLRHHKLILKSLGEAVHILDLKGNILFWNRNAELLYGYSASEAIGQNIARLLVDPRDILPLHSIIGDIHGQMLEGKISCQKQVRRAVFCSR